MKGERVGAIRRNQHLAGGHQLRGRIDRTEAALSADVFGSDADRDKAFDSIEVDNCGNEGPTTYWAVNGRTASSVLPTFRLPPDAIDRMFIRATTIRVVSAGGAATIYVRQRTDGPQGKPEARAAQGEAVHGAREA